MFKKIIKLIMFLPLIAIPFVMQKPEKFEFCKLQNDVFPLNDNINELKKQVDKLDEKVDKLESKIDKAQLCKIKKDIDDIKKIVYALMGVIGGSGVLVGSTNLVKKKKT